MIPWITKVNEGLKQLKSLQSSVDYLKDQREPLDDYSECTDCHCLIRRSTTNLSEKKVKSRWSPRQGDREYIKYIYRCRRCESDYLKRKREKATCSTCGTSPGLPSGHPFYAEAQL